MRAWSLQTAAVLAILERQLTADVAPRLQVGKQQQLAMWRGVACLIGQAHRQGPASSEAGMQFGTLKARVEMLRKPRANITPVRNARIKGSTGYRIRDAILTRDAGVCQCARCIRDGAVRLAHEVDHVVPIWAGGREADDNRASINRDCHRLKTADEAGMRARGVFDPEAWARVTLAKIAAPGGA